MLLVGSDQNQASIVLVRLTLLDLRVLLALMVAHGVLGEGRARVCRGIGLPFKVHGTLMRTFLHSSLLLCWEDAIKPCSAEMNVVNNALGTLATLSYLERLLSK